jgi:hypothetical protein
MEITINIDVLEEQQLSISEYVYLKALYDKRKPKDMKRIVSCIDRIEEDALQMKGFIKITPNQEVVLRQKGASLFDSASLFTRFLVMFPVKTPSGRYLSPRGYETVMGRKLEDKWNKRFLNKPDKERRALEVLDAELKWRRENNKMEFMHNAETWINQGDYEKFEYLLDEQQEAEEHLYNDFME